MTASASQPHLWLVSGHRDTDAQPWLSYQQARLAIVKENRLAAHAMGMDPTDPRWALAMQTQARLQGTVLTPDKRGQLLKIAAKLGLRPFDSNLVVAIVQDRARAGLPLHQARSTLSLIPTPNTSIKKARKRQGLRWLLAITAGAMIAVILILVLFSE